MGMKFCVYGAGAIGGCLAVELATAGHDVCVIARGDHLKAIQARGLILRIAGREKIARVHQCARLRATARTIDFSAYRDERNSLVVFLQERRTFRGASVTVRGPGGTPMAVHRAFAGTSG